MPLGSMPLLVQKVRSSAATTASCIVLRHLGERDRLAVLLREPAELGLAVRVVDVGGLGLEVLVRRSGIVGRAVDVDETDQRAAMPTSAGDDQADLQRLQHAPPGVPLLLALLPRASSSMPRPARAGLRAVAHGGLLQGAVGVDRGSRQHERTACGRPTPRVEAYRASHASARRPATPPDCDVDISLR